MKVAVQFVSSCGTVFTKLQYSFYQTAVQILSRGGPVDDKQQTRGGTVTILENQLKSKKSENKRGHLKNRMKWLITYLQLKVVTTYDNF